MDVIEDVIAFNRQLSADLWNLVDGGRRTSAPQLVFPKGRNGNVRISEQEARVLYCAIIDQQTKYTYSIETPTDGKYRFVDARPDGTTQSALSDMSLYANGERVVNVELKAHNCAPKQIDKDISKLVQERRVSNWYHTLKSLRGGTLPSLFAKFRAATAKVADWPRLPMIFTFCVLEQKWAISKTLPAQPDRESFRKVTAEFFDIGYSSTGRTVTASQVNGWEIITPGK